MMHLISITVYCALCPTVLGNLLDKLTLNTGFKLGKGISVHLDRLERVNSSLLENHVLRIDCFGVGLSVKKVSNKDALEVGLYVGDGEIEGRRRQVGELVLPAIIGSKVTGMAILVFGGLMLFLFSAFALTKLAVLVSIGILIAKYLGSSQNSSSFVEVEPVYHSVYQQPSVTGYSGSGSENYLAYANYAPLGQEEVDQNGQYAILGYPIESSSNMYAIPIAKRRNHSKKKPQPIPMKTVTRSTIRQ